MTPQEAKKIIFNQWQSFLEDNIDYGGISEAYKMAIKALEQQPCEDCISREETIRIAEQGQIQGYEWQFKKLCNLPSVTPNEGWIPVSERLPDTVDDYLVTIEHKGEIEGVDVATYGLGGYIDGLWDTVNDWIEGASENWSVTAWMPLPAPYKKEGDNNE